MKKNTNINTEQLIANLGEALQRMINKTLEDSPAVILGVNESAFTVKVNALNRAIASANEALVSYAKLLPGKILSPELLNEISSLPNDPALLPTQIKMIYLDHHKVAIPGVKFSKTSLAEAYDFTHDELNLIAAIAFAVLQFKKTNHGLHPELWNTKTFRFEITENEIEKIREQFTVYATAEQLTELIAVDLILSGSATLQNIGHDLKNDLLVEYLRGKAILEGRKITHNIHSYIGANGSEFVFDDRELAAIKMEDDSQGLPSFSVNGTTYRIEQSEFISLELGNVNVRELRATDHDKFLRACYLLWKKQSGFIKQVA